VRADDCRRLQNILVLFDASGYMKEKGRYKILLKQMNYFTDAMPLTMDGFFDVGLRHYGLKVGMGCDNTESVLAVQPWDPERFLNSFPKTVSYGVSSLSGGMRAAAEEVASLPGKSIILLVGGGIESCKSDPIKIADRIAFNNPDLEIHTFQIGNSQEGRFFLKAIAKKCNGTYNDVRGMSSPAGWHAWMRGHLVVPCGPSGPAEAQLPARQIGPVVFDFNSFSVGSKDPAVDAANRASLDAVGQFLKANPSARVVLHGFTDGKGNQQFNLKLSRKRAEAVSRHLSVTHGVPQSQIAIIAHGIAQDASRARPGARRRVEFEIFQ